MKTRFQRCGSKWNGRQVASPSSGHSGTEDALLAVRAWQCSTAKLTDGQSDQAGLERGRTGVAGDSRRARHGWLRTSLSPWLAAIPNGR